MNRLAFMTDICGVRFGGLAAVVSFGLEGPDVPRKSKAPGEADNGDEPFLCC